MQALDAGYGALQVLWDIHLELHPGERFAVIGPNGSGTSTLLKVVQGLIQPIRGKILFDGQDVSGLPPHRRVELGLVLVPEGRRLFPEMSIRENLELGAYPRRARGGLREGLERAFRLFPVLKMRADALAGTLSGGEQQMLAIARGLMAHPKLLLLDEPFLGLAPQPAAKLEEAIRGLQAEGVTILMAGQHLKRLLTLADRACLLQGGRIILEGGRDVLLQSDLVRRALSS